MTQRTRRIYRAVAHYAATPAHPDGNTLTRHFHTRGARDAWADRRLEGYPAEPGEYGRPGIAPATHIDYADSDPITWPTP